MQHQIRTLLADHPHMPVVTFQPGDDVRAFMQFLLQQEVRCIEITLRTAAGMKAIETLRQEMPAEVLIGAGTVTSGAQIEQLKQVQADFMVSPGLTADLQQQMEDSGIPYLPGVATPSEIVAAAEKGLDTLKFFPANLFGGMKALQTYGNVFPGIKFCPTGGVTRETSASYLELSNVFAVGGSWFQAEYAQQ